MGINVITNSLPVILANAPGYTPAPSRPSKDCGPAIGERNALGNHPALEAFKAAISIDVGRLAIAKAAERFFGKEIPMKFVLEHLATPAGGMHMTQTLNTIHQTGESIALAALVATGGYSAYLGLHALTGGTILLLGTTAP